MAPALGGDHLIRFQERKDDAWVVQVRPISIGAGSFEVNAGNAGVGLLGLQFTLAH